MCGHTISIHSSYFIALVSLARKLRICSLCLNLFFRLSFIQGELFVRVNKKMCFILPKKNIIRKKLSKMIPTNVDAAFPYRNYSFFNIQAHSTSQAMDASCGYEISRMLEIELDFRLSSQHLETSKSVQMVDSINGQMHMSEDLQKPKLLRKFALMCCTRNSRSIDTPFSFIQHAKQSV